MGDYLINTDISIIQRAELLLYRSSSMYYNTIEAIASKIADEYFIKFTSKIMQPFDELPEKYVNPFTDFGFKRLFGSEPNKDLLIDFLSTLLYKEQGNIVDLTYLPQEQLGRSEEDRRAVYDLYCKNEKGEFFLVELQKSEHKNFKERMIYYSTFPIRNQAVKGNIWNFALKAVYCIGILDFTFDDTEPDKYHTEVMLTDLETNKVFYDKLKFIFLEMPKFNKELEQLDNHFEKWLYLLKNINRLHSMPEKLQDRIFTKFFRTAEIAKFTSPEYDAYQQSLKYERVMNAVLNFVEEKGLKKGIKEGIKKGKEIGIQKGKEIGIQEGKEIGIQEGKELGIQEGIQKKEYSAIKNALMKGKLSDEEIAEMLEVSIDKVLDVKNNLV